MTDQLPEAPASVTIKYKSKNGFEHLFTLRATTGKELIKKMAIAEQELIDNGATPVVMGIKYTQKLIEYVDSRFCPKCKGKLVYSTKKDGSKFIKCENNKWDRINNKPTGCSFIEWPNTNKDDNAPTFSDY